MLVGVDIDKPSLEEVHAELKELERGVKSWHAEIRGMMDVNSPNFQMGVYRYLLNRGVTSDNRHQLALDKEEGVLSYVDQKSKVAIGTLPQSVVMVYGYGGYAPLTELRVDWRASKPEDIVKEGVVFSQAFGIRAVSQSWMLDPKDRTVAEALIAFTYGQASKLEEWSATLLVSKMGDRPIPVSCFRNGEYIREVSPLEYDGLASMMGGRYLPYGGRRIDILGHLKTILA